MSRVHKQSYAKAGNNSANFPSFCWIFSIILDYDPAFLCLLRTLRKPETEVVLKLVLNIFVSKKHG